MIHLNAREDSEPPTFHATRVRPDFGYSIMIIQGRESSVPTKIPSSDEVEGAIYSASGS